MKKMATLLFAAGALALAADAPQTYIGTVTDTMCGANHQAMHVSPEDKCVRECVKHDRNTRYALLVGSKVYVLSDQQSPEKFAARKVKVTGTLYEKTGILKVSSIEAAK